MIAVVQRVNSAQVSVHGTAVGQIGPGLCVLAAIHHDDTEADVTWAAAKLVGLRIFRNADKHFDLDVLQIHGSLLLVSNFTVAGDTRKGRRPSLDGAAPPELGRRLFDVFIDAVRAAAGPDVVIATGQFGADMHVELVNDGPVTFLIDSRDARGASRQVQSGG
jgi:D-aminoacyl-tRNA deacylase